MKKAIALFLLCTLCVITYWNTNRPDQDPFLYSDYSRLHPVKVERVVAGREEEQFMALIQEAKEKKLTISIAGQRHSQGGHTFYKDGIVLDMTSYNRILELHPENKTIRVQSGATWEDIQEAINPHGLAVKTMQSQNIFTVGGSISINAHGRDIRHGSMIESVQSFRLLTADGNIIHVSRTENEELFPLVLGGFGLFGVILDVTLSLTDDEVYTVSSEETSVKDYAEAFTRQVLVNPKARMHIARISIAPDDFLEDMYMTTYIVDPHANLQEYHQLKRGEDAVALTKFLFHLNRSFDWGKNFFWDAQKSYFLQQKTKISRNNAMRSESAFMEYRVAGKNDLLQEYFIPVDQFADFVESMKPILREEDMNLLNITVRYVTKDQEAVLSYAQQDMFALVCLFNAPLADEEQRKLQKGIQKIIDQVIAHKGTYYLPYVAYPTQEQFEVVYPRHAEFFEKKELYDPAHLFMNYFYQDYKGE